MMSYLIMMVVRLIEIRRALKSSGSVYLHCDPTASHHLKMLMDVVFGPKFSPANTMCSCSTPKPTIRWQSSRPRWPLADTEGDPLWRTNASERDAPRRNAKTY